jgi:hypothetical protein
MDDEFAFHVKEYEDRELARSIIEADLAHSLKTGSNSPAFGLMRCLIATVNQHAHRLKPRLLEKIDHRRSYSRLVHN